MNQNCIVQIENNKLNKKKIFEKNDKLIFKGGVKANYCVLLNALYFFKVFFLNIHLKKNSKMHWFLAQIYLLNVCLSVCWFLMWYKIEKKLDKKSLGIHSKVFSQRDKTYVEASKGSVDRWIFTKKWIGNHLSYYVFLRFTHRK